jgi:hypothetical protein
VSIRSQSIPRFGHGYDAANRPYTYPPRNGFDFSGAPHGADSHETGRTVGPVLVRSFVAVASEKKLNNPINDASDVLGRQGPAARLEATDGFRVTDGHRPAGSMAKSVGFTTTSAFHSNCASASTRAIENSSSMRSLPHTERLVRMRPGVRKFCSFRRFAACSQTSTRWGEIPARSELPRIHNRRKILEWSSGGHNRRGRFHQRNSTALPG